MGIIVIITQMESSTTIFRMAHIMDPRITIMSDIVIPDQISDKYSNKSIRLAGYLFVSWTVFIKVFA